MQSLADVGGDLPRAPPVDSRPRNQDDPHRRVNYAPGKCPRCLSQQTLRTVPGHRATHAAARHYTEARPRVPFRPLTIKHHRIIANDPLPPVVDLMKLPAFSKLHQSARAGSGNTTRRSLHERSPQSAHGGFASDRQAFTTLGAASFQHEPPAFGVHSLAKTVVALAFDVSGLKSPFH